MKNHCFTRALAALATTLAAGGGWLCAGGIAVPNGSFESPTPPPGYPATPLIDVWQKSPQPDWFDPATTGITWQQLSGVFPNTAAGSADHIDNLDGSQAAYLFALPQVALSQQLTATYEPGMAYRLTLGILGSGGITEGSSFMVGLYYLDSTSQPVTIASTPITYSSASFPTATHLVDYSVNTPIVQAGDAWAGQGIGIQLIATSGTGAGYWDVDNVRLVAIPEPAPSGLLLLGLGALWLVRRHRTPTAGPPFSPTHGILRADPSNSPRD